MFFGMFRMGRGVYRFASSRPAKPRQPMGAPPLAWIIGAAVIIGPMVLLEHHDVQRGEAFLMLFPLFAVILALGAALKGNRPKSRARTGGDIRRAHTAMQARKSSNGRRM